MDIVSTQQRNKIHPHKFTLWVAIGSIVMMFAGLTSAYIVKSGQANWVEVQTPKVFWYSTAVLLISSLTIQSALRSFKQKNNGPVQDPADGNAGIRNRICVSFSGQGSNGFGTTVSGLKAREPASSCT
jgi:hypothetical protein